MEEGGRLTASRGWEKRMGFPFYIILLAFQGYWQPSDTLCAGAAVSLSPSVYVWYEEEGVSGR